MFKRLTLMFAKWRRRRCYYLSHYFHKQLKALLDDTMRRNRMDALDEIEALEYARLSSLYADKASRWAKIVIAKSIPVQSRVLSVSLQRGPEARAA